MGKNKPAKTSVESLKHKAKRKTKYQHDVHIDPYLRWAGKKEEHNSFKIPTVSLHIR